MKAIVFDTPGDEGVLRWDDAPEPACGPGQVVLATHATAVNRADLLQRLGFYPPPSGASEILGLEASGTVVEVGAGVHGWHVGDRAMVIVAGGGYGERIAVDAGSVMPIPDGFSLTDAAAIPEVFLTAFLNLFVLGRLSEGERVLVHGGSGGVGTAAVQMAKQAGAEVWTTAGGPERCEKCRYLGADVAVDHRSDDFAERLAGAGGADVILDIMGAKYLGPNLKALRPDGRMVVIGLQGGVKGEINLGLLLSRRLQVIGSTLRALSVERKAALVTRFLEEWRPHFESGSVAPVVDRVMSIEEAGDAHRVMAAGGQFGKIVMTFPGGEG